MSEDLISRQAVLALPRNKVRNLRTYEVIEETINVKDIENLPSAQPEPAQWVQMLINPHLYKCSNCQVAWNKRLVFDNEGHSENIFMKYCPCCGRKMKAKIDYE